MTTAYDFTVTTLAGEPKPLSDFRDKVLLVVNTASRCGFTPQYAGLQALHQRFAPLGLAVLGFPCNQFGHQEPGSADEIASFCSLQYGVDFPMFAKVDVNGEAAAPLFRFLKNAAPGVLGSQAIKWNFTKFLVDRDGTTVRRYGPQTDPASIAEDIEVMLDRSAAGA